MSKAITKRSAIFITLRFSKGVLTEVGQIQGFSYSMGHFFSSENQEATSSADLQSKPVRSCLKEG